MEYTHSRRPIELPPSPPLTPLARINAHEAPVVPNERVPLLQSTRSSSPTPTTSTIVLSTPKPSRLEMFLGMSYASFSGILSGMCLIFAKSGVELLMLTIGGHNQFGRWETWVLLIGLGVFALLQLWYLHKSLVLANPTLVCPRKLNPIYLVCIY
jgi:magnesium transporter